MFDDNCFGFHSLVLSTTFTWTAVHFSKKKFHGIIQLKIKAIKLNILRSMLKIKNQNATYWSTNLIWNVEFKTHKSFTVLWPIKIQNMFIYKKTKEVQTDLKNITNTKTSSFTNWNDFVSHVNQFAFKQMSLQT